MYLAYWGNACTLDALLEGPSENRQALRAQHGRVPLAITACLALGCHSAWWLRFSTDFALLPRRVQLVHFVIDLNAQNLSTERKDPHEVPKRCTIFQVHEPLPRRCQQTAVRPESWLRCVREADVDAGFP